MRATSGEKRATSLTPWFKFKFPFSITGGFMKQILLFLGFGLLNFAIAQEDIVYQDYMTFGRREPVSLGSVFSALGNEPIFFNPASVALVTDNRINFGGSYSDLGNSYMLSWTAPNLSISSALHKADINDSTYNAYQKDLLKFSFAVSNQDLGIRLNKLTLALGVAAKLQSDKLFSEEGDDFGGDAVSIDLGFHLSWQYLTFEIAMLNINEPNLGDSDLSYARAFSICTRYLSPSGFTIAVQGINSRTYAGSDFGLNIAAQQAFFNNRLVSRLQLTSFFSGTEATMQNISGSVGYRPLVKQKLYFLQDIEISYTLSFLAMPKTVGTHLFVMTKYF
jgi:hypothetical protein